MRIDIIKNISLALEAVYLFFYLNNKPFKKSDFWAFRNYALYTVIILLFSVLDFSYSFLCVFSTIGIVLLVISSYHLHVSEKIIYSSSFLIIVRLMTLLTLIIILFIDREFNENGNIILVSISSMLSWAASLGLLIFVKKRIDRFLIDINYSTPILLPLLLEVCLIVYFTYLILEFKYSLNNNSSILFLALFITIVFILCYILLIKNYLSEKKKTADLERLNALMQKQNNYIEMKSSAENDIRKIYHDLNNYLIYINSVNIQGVKEVNDLINTVSKYNAYVETGNKVLNTLINEKYIVACDKGIIMNCNIDFKDGYFIEPLDICSIFGNLIDNAIEYCEAVEDEQYKYIDIVAATQNNFLIVKICNGLHKNIVVTDNSIKTTKVDKINHGIGLTSVQDSVKKYGGQFSISANNNEFIASILFVI